jgi:hypothetical protein
MKADHKVKHYWIILPSIDLTFSPRFLDTFAEQLVNLALKATGLDIRSGFSLHFLPEEESHWDRQTQRFVTSKRDVPYWDEDNIAYVDAQLGGPDGEHIFVRVAWRCESHRQERILPGNSLLPEDGHQVRVWWAYLPVDELRQKYLYPPTPRVPDIGNVSFEIEWSPWWERTLDEDDIYLELQTNQPVPDNILAEANNRLREAVTTFGEGELQEIAKQITIDQKITQKFQFEEVEAMAAHGFANHMLGMQQSGENRYSLYVDCWLACEATLAHWLRRLDVVSDMLLLTKVKVR